MKEQVSGIYYPDNTFHKVAPLIEKPPATIPKTFDEYIDYFQKLREIRKTEDIWKTEVDITAKTNGLPFFLIPLADLHLGSSDVDYPKVKEYLKFIKDYPVQTVLIGDLVDNFSPTLLPVGMLDDVAPPTDQLGSVRAFFKEYHQKIIGNYCGNHDSGTRRSSGTDIFRWLNEDLNVPLLHGGGVINLKVDDEQYKIIGFHRIVLFHSNFNPNHAGKRALEFYKDADCVISGHHHRGGVEKLSHRDGKKPVIVSCGTFKTEDTFQRDSGRIVPFDVFYPILCFFPQRHNIEAIENLDVAKEFIDAVYLYYKQIGQASLGLK